MFLISGEDPMSNSSGDILVPWGSTVGLNFPYGVIIVNRSLLSSSRGFWEYPDVKSIAPKYLCLGLSLF